jgi:hypothetical protein
MFVILLSLAINEDRKILLKRNVLIVSCCSTIKQSYSELLLLTAELYSSKRPLVVIGGIVVSVLAIGPSRGLNPGRERWIFNSDKNPQHDFLRRGSKEVGPMS